MGTSSGNSGTVHGTYAVTTLRIDRPMLEQIRRIAEENQRTVSQELRWLMLRRIEEHSIEREAA